MYEDIDYFLFKKNVIYAIVTIGIASLAFKMLKKKQMLSSFKKSVSLYYKTPEKAESLGKRIFHPMGNLALSLSLKSYFLYF